MRAWGEVIAAVPSAAIELGEVTHRMKSLMADYGIASYDAIHVATALESGVGCIVTIDVGFAHVPESQLVLYVDASRVARCREVRGRS